MTITRLWFLLLLGIFSCEGKTNSCTDVGKFLIVADTHIEHCFDEQKVLRNKHSPMEEQCFTAMNDGFPHYGLDSSWSLLNSTVKAMKAAVPDPDFVMVLGDYVRHDMNVGSSGKMDRDSINNAIEEIFQRHVDLFQETWGDATDASLVQDVRRMPQTQFPLFVLGNNDVQPNYFHPLDNKPFEWLATVGHRFRESLQNDARAMDEFKRGGFYKLPSTRNSKIVFLVMNTVLYSPLNPNSVPHVHPDPKRGFRWLKKQLQLAEKEGKYVYIVGHIAPSADHYVREMSYTWLWNPEYIELYKKFTKPFLNKVIKGQFFGHEHNDLFRLNDDSLMMVHSSVSPFYRNNPAFREYTYCRETGDILDFQEWHLELQDRKPEMKTVDELKWRPLFGSVLKEFGLADLSYSSIVDFTRRMCRDWDLFRRYLNIAVARSESAADVIEVTPHVVCMASCNILFIHKDYENCHAACIEDPSCDLVESHLLKSDFGRQAHRLLLEASVPSQ